jgi:hypothetical protein
MPTAYGVVDHREHYADVYSSLLDLITAKFAHVESGMQGDAWIWVFRDGQKVEIDTFYAMQFEINADEDGELLRDVVRTLQPKYPIRLYDPPIER